MDFSFIYGLAFGVIAGYSLSYFWKVAQQNDQAELTGCADISMFDEVRRYPS